MSMLVSGMDVNFYLWVVLQNWKCMLTSTTSMVSSSSLAHNCSGPALICPAATKAYTATTWFLNDQKDLFASGSTVMYVFFLFCFFIAILLFAVLLWNYLLYFFIKSTFNNPEWFYRHVDNHVESAEPQSLAQQQQALFCQWTGTSV